MPSASTTPALRRDPAAREIVRAWRSIAGGREARDDERPTLIACSAGADSSALAIALGQVRRARLVVAHIVHDLRPPEAALRDRDGARDLAGRLDVPFVEAEVETRAHRGNPESIARTLRYRALARLAREHGCRYVATAHHAGDQIETLLMRLLRGTGVRGLSGIAPSRALSRAVALVRPMLTVTRADAERLCVAAGWNWREDATNADTTRLRAALRARVVPVLAELSPKFPARAAATSRVLREAADFVAGHARAVLESGRHGAGFRWARADLRALHPAVLHEALRAATAEVSGGHGRDRLSHAPVLRVAHAARSPSTEPRRFRLAGATILVSARLVTIEPTAARNGPLHGASESDE